MRPKTTICGRGTPNTYTISPSKTSITFQPCGTKSYHPKDIENRYCGRCHRFIDDERSAHDSLQKLRP